MSDSRTLNSGLRRNLDSNFGINGTIKTMHRKTFSSSKHIRNADGQWLTTHFCVLYEYVPELYKLMAVGWLGVVLEARIFKYHFSFIRVSYKTSLHPGFQLLAEWSSWIVAWLRVLDYTMQVFVVLRISRINCWCSVLTYMFHEMYCSSELRYMVITVPLLQNVPWFRYLSSHLSL